MRAGKDYSKLAGDTSYEVLTLLRFGRFDEILEVKDRPGQVVQGAFWDFAQGYARLKLGEPDFAALYLKRIKETAETATAGFRFYTARELLPIVAGILEGEMQRMAGDLTAAIASFERASSLQEGLTYDEPEPVPFSAFHWLGAALLEAGRNDEAEQAYRRELKDHPKNGWSLFGIRQAKLAKGEAVDAITQEFDASWARSDTWIRGSKF
jgi:tetratricopeptide (TPR) repeat protein